MKKILIFDASTLISFSMNGLYEELRKLKQSFNGYFIIPQEVKEEVIDKPIQRKRFELEALKIKQLLDEGILEFPEHIGENQQEISELTQELLTKANEMFVDSKRNKPIKLIDAGETACLALSKILSKKGFKNVIAVDERTTRMLVEKPQNLKQLLERKLHTRVKLNKQNFQEFKGIKIIRSAELVYILNKKGLVNLRDLRALDALLYAVKFKGCSITDDEIKEIKRIK